MYGRLRKFVICFEFEIISRPLVILTSDVTMTTLATHQHRKDLSRDASQTLVFHLMTSSVAALHLVVVVLVASAIGQSLCLTST